MTSHAMPIEILMPVMMVGAAAGKTTRKAFLNGLTSSVRETSIHSFLTDATPNAVLMSIGHTEQIKMTNMADTFESLSVNKAKGIHARGDMGLRTWINGSRALNSTRDMPITKPSGMATTAANRKPKPTREMEQAS